MFFPFYTNFADTLNSVVYDGFVKIAYLFHREKEIGSLRFQLQQPSQ